MKGKKQGYGAFFRAAVDSVGVRGEDDAIGGKRLRTKFPREKSAQLYVKTKLYSRLSYTGRRIRDEFGGELSTSE